MITYYNYPADSDKQISDHFQMGEFVTFSDYGGSYPEQVPIDSDLLHTLENIYEHFGCDCAVISSGYRTPACDISVGGTGNGYHTLGMAADVQFIKDGEPLHSRLIACYAQDIGVKGIGYRCGGAEYWTHLDSRQSNIWYGDETDYSYGYNDFYGYTGTTKEEVYGGGGGDQPAGTASVAVTIDGVLSNGSTGRAVYVLQALLLSHGYGAGGVDGIFGNGTEAAVREFQGKNALEVDGVAGKNTFEKLAE
jgi:peptidoglycan hydrolase-like protein with peptidoglycan-binding domain